MFSCPIFCGTGPFAHANFRGGTIAAQHPDADCPALKSHKQLWLVVAVGRTNGTEGFAISMMPEEVGPQTSERLRGARQVRDFSVVLLGFTSNADAYSDSAYHCGGLGVH
jgi:hypothetical protein